MFFLLVLECSMKEYTCNYSIATHADDAITFTEAIEDTCAAKCTLDPDCLSYHFSSEYKMCHLSRTDTQQCVKSKSIIITKLAILKKQKDICLNQSFEKSFLF